MTAPAVDHQTLAFIGTQAHFRWLNGIAKWILPLNLIDAMLTLWWIRTGVAEEGNLFIFELAHGDAVVFMLAKLMLVSLGIIFLWKNRQRPAAVISIFAGFLAYYLVLLHHLTHVGALL
jgi:hypothetical protein